MATREDLITALASNDPIWTDIRLADAPKDDPCAICAGPRENCGLEFVLHDTEDLICLSCARVRAPEQIEMLERIGRLIVSAQS